MASIKTIFISAAKYRGINDAEGIDAALNTLCADIGAKPELLIVKTPEWSVGQGQIAAMVKDIDVVVGTGGTGGNLRGLGPEAQAAKRDLLENLLTPEQNIPPGYDKKQTGLAVGGLFEPRTIVKIQP